MANILVADADLGFRERLAQDLRQAGHEVTIADCGTAVLDVSAAVPEIMLLDLRLPDITGFEILRRLIHRGITIRTLVMAACCLEADANDAFALGALAFLRKPVDLDLTRSLVGRLSTSESEELSWRVLHSRVLREGCACREAAAGQLLRTLRPRLHAVFITRDAHNLDEAIEDAIIRYLNNPRQFDPSRGVSLIAFLAMCARRRVVNLARTATSRIKREEAYGVLQRTAHFDMHREHDAQLGRQLIAQALQTIEDPGLRKALATWLDGDRTSKPFMNVSGFTELKYPDLARAIKRCKDAFVRRVVRLRNDTL